MRGKELLNFLNSNNLIWIVGSGSLDAFPVPGCNCRLCEMARKGGKDKRLPATSIFYKNCLFDIGPGIWERLKKRKIKPKAIILSHVHLDHISSLIDFPKISKIIPVWASVFYQDLFQDLNIKANYFEPGLVFKPIPELSIKTRLGIHTWVEPLSLLKFDKIVYAPDLGGLSDLDLDWAEGVKLWIGDGWNLDKPFIFQNEKLHMSVRQLIDRLRSLKSLEHLLLTGIGHHSNYPHEDYELLLYKLASDLKLPFKVELAYDNLIIKTSWQKKEM